MHSIQCGICGHAFVAGDKFMRDLVPANGESDSYERVVHPDCDDFTPAEIEAGVLAGTIKVLPPKFMQAG